MMRKMSCLVVGGEMEQCGNQIRANVKWLQVEFEMEVGEVNRL